MFCGDGLKWFRDVDLRLKKEIFEFNRCSIEEPFVVYDVDFQSLLENFLISTVILCNIVSLRHIIIQVVLY